MKKLILILSTVMSAQAFAANVLIDLKTTAGFSAKPKAHELKVSDSGEVTLTTKDLRSGETSTTTVAALSVPVVKKIQESIDAIPADAKLIDLDAGKPSCTDLPTQSVYILKAGVEVKIAGEASCHVSALEQPYRYTSETLAKLAQSLFVLSASSL